ncbi:MAG: hypothetical protein LYZ69_06455 [Nitrososphaerales archaeon]|nr:hypothetical protein [Nitrososphaerales archaeon]
MAQSDPLRASNPRDFHWKPKETLPPGAHSFNVFGNPPEGNYAFFGKFPAKYAVPMHWHTNDVWVAIIEGSMIIRRTGWQEVRIGRGGFFFLPRKMQYIVDCPEECVFLAYGYEPFDIHYLDENDDPRNRK